MLMAFPIKTWEMITVMAVGKIEKIQKKSKLSFVVTLLLFFVLIFVNHYCTNDTNPVVIDPKIRSLLTNVSQRVVIPAYSDFKQKADALQTATRAYSGSIGTANETTRLGEAQTAWRSAMQSWQKTEVMQIGPAGASGKRTGGKGSRDEIYSWPTSSTCRIDTEIVNHEFNGADFFRNQNVNSYGLDAIEYLLFYSSTDTTCPATATISTNGAWAALSSDEIKSRRASYAQASAEEVARKAGELLAEWQNSFGAALSNAGEPGSIFIDQNAALNEILAGMFYIDLITKDQKLAKPLGLTDDCSSVCAERRESRYANYSKEAIIANLNGLQEIFLGNAVSADPEYGFDDYLADKNASSTATELTQEMNTATTNAQAVTGTLNDALVSDEDAVRTLHANIKKITDRLKGGFVTSLNLTIPRDAAGDGD